MTPASLRKAIKEGRWTCVTRRWPEPPPEWPPNRRDRMRVAIRCAALFLVQGKVWHEVMSNVKREGLIDETGVSRARINQYVDKGMRFLLDRGVFKEVRKVAPRVGRVD